MRNVAVRRLVSCTASSLPRRGAYSILRQHRQLAGRYVHTVGYDSARDVRFGGTFRALLSNLLFPKIPLREAARAPQLLFFA